MVARRKQDRLRDSPGVYFVSLVPVEKPMLLDMASQNEDCNESIDLN